MQAGQSSGSLDFMKSRAQRQIGASLVSQMNTQHCGRHMVFAAIPAVLTGTTQTSPPGASVNSLTNSPGARCTVAEFAEF
jgi:hypothetical protein